MAKSVNTKVGALRMVERAAQTTGEVYWSGRGEISTLSTTYQIGVGVLERDPSAPPATDDTPTHGIYVLIGNGQQGAQIGVAWQRKITRGDFVKKPMFSIAINHPEMPDWMSNLAAFPRDDHGTYSIEHQWQRAAPAARGGAESSSAGPDDEIPY